MTSASRSETFLRLYNTLDRALRKELKAKPSVSHAELLNRKAATDPFIRDHSSELHAFRALRNAIVHMSGSGDGDDGRPIAEPHPQTLASYQALVDYVLERPPALKTGIATTDLYTVEWDTPVLPALRHMLERSFRIAPILENGGLVGVFTETTLMRLLCSEGRLALDPDARFRAFADVCCNLTEGDVRLVGRDTAVDRIEGLFREAFSAGRALSVVCITDEPHSGSPLRGIVTPHDLPGASGNRGVSLHGARSDHLGTGVSRGSAAMSEGAITVSSKGTAAP